MVSTAVSPGGGGSFFVLPVHRFPPASSFSPKTCRVGLVCIIGVNESVNGCLSLHLSPEMCWQPVQDVPPPPPPPPPSFFPIVSSNCLQLHPQHSIVSGKACGWVDVLWVGGIPVYFMSHPAMLWVLLFLVLSWSGTLTVIATLILDLKFLFHRFLIWPNQTCWILL